MKRILTLYLLVSFGLCLLNAQDQDTTKLSDYYIDLSVPDLAISGLMDVTSDNVYKPANFSEFAWQVYNDLEGKSGTGYGLELPLSTFLKKGKINLTKYREKPGLFNTRFSLGFLNSQEGLNVAAGLKINVFNHADPYRDQSLIKDLAEILFGDLKSREKTIEDFQNAISIVNRKLVNSPGLPDAVAALYNIEADTALVDCNRKEALWQKIKDSVVTQDEFDLLHKAFNAMVLARQKTGKTRNAALKKRKDQFSADTWNASFMTVSYGLLWNGNDSRVSSLRYNKYHAVWAWGKPVFGNLSQLILNLQYTSNIGGSTLANGTDADPLLDQRNKLFLGGRWLLKTNKANKLVTGHLFVEGGYTETSFYNRELEKVFVGLVGAEFRLLSRFWVQGGIGVSNDQGKFQFSLKQNIGEKSRF